MQECSPLQGTRGRGPGKKGCGIASPAAQALSPGHHEGSRPLPLRTHPGTCLPGCWSGRPADVTRRNMGWGRSGQAACRRGFQGLSAQSPRELTAAVVEVGPASLVKPPPTGGAPERVCTRGPGMGGRASHVHARTRRVAQRPQQVGVKVLKRACPPQQRCHLSQPPSFRPEL